FFASRASCNTRSESVFMKAVEEIAATKQNPVNTRILDKSTSPVVTLRIESRSVLEIMFKNKGTNSEAAIPKMTLFQKLLPPGSSFRSRKKLTKPPRVPAAKITQMTSTMNAV